MQLRTTFWILAFTTAAGLIAADSVDSPKIMLEAAHKKELVDGDLNGAIKQYAAIVAKYAKTDRAASAMALVHMAECHQKLGDMESGKIYEQVLRDYADQKEAVTLARTHLGHNAPARETSIMTRQVWASPKADVYGAVSPDARLLTFVDQQTGDLALHDLSTGDDRHLTNKGSWSDSGEYAEQSVFAPDGKQVAYSWFDKNGRYDLRVIGLNPSSRTPRVLYANPDIDWIAPYDWSRDGKWIAVQIQRKDRTAQMGLVATSDGTLRILKSVDWRGSLKMAFSPDSRYLAFDLPAGDSAEQRHVFVLAIDGSFESPAVVHPSENLVSGWSPDGKYLLIGSDRTGKMAIYALPFEGGKIRGAGKLAVSDIGQAAVIGLARSGTLFYGIKNGSRDFLTASVDFDSGKVLAAPSPAAQKFLGANYHPSWSRDGQYLSYHSYREHRILLLVIRSLATGQTRELRPKLSHFESAEWFADGRSFLVHGRDLKGRQGIYRINAQTGDTEPIVVSAPGQVSFVPLGTSDGKKIYYLRGSDGSRLSLKVVIERDLASSTERELPGARCTGALSIAADNASLACGTLDPATKQPGLAVISVADGASRDLLRLQQENAVTFTFTEWTPDGRFIAYRNGAEVWVIPVSGGQPRKIELGSADPVLDLRIHPDGRRIAFLTRTKTTQEIWAVENLLSAVTTSQ
jgi:Tol biopolymer transport system component